MTTTEPTTHRVPTDAAAGPAVAVPVTSALHGGIPRWVDRSAQSAGTSGSSLNLDPLVVLLVTTAAGLVGGVGLIVLAAPLTVVISRTTRRLAAARQLHPDPAGDASPA